MATTCSETEEDFSKYLGQMSNMTLISHGISLGSQLGIFEVMGEFDEPQTSDAIAKRGGWKPRYIQEWLGLMVCGKVIDYIEHNNTFYIPKQRRTSLLLSGKSKNVSGFMQGIDIAVGVTNELLSCFDKDGPKGIPYSSYTGFHEWRSVRQSNLYHWDNLKQILNQIPSICEKLEKGIAVMDAGCSTGHQIMTLAEMYPKSIFVGFDIDANVVRIANETSKKRSLDNVSFEVADACNMPKHWHQTIELLMVWDVVHDVPKPKDFLLGIMNVLKPGGIFFMNDIYMHSEIGKNIALGHAPTYYGLSLYHCMPISLYFEGGEGLGTAWGIEKQKEYLQEAGFQGIKHINGPAKTQSYIISYKPE